MTSKAGRHQKAPAKDDALIEAEKLLEELAAKDPKLAAAKKAAREAGNGINNVGESTARSYRQHLKR